MNEEIYKKNVKALVNRFESITEEKIATCMTIDTNLKIEKSRTGVYIPVINFNGKSIWLNSKYRAAEECEKWASEQRKAENMATMIMFGLGNGMYVRTMLEKNIETSRIIVYEPNPEIFIKVIQEVDFTDLFTSQRFFIIIDGLNKTDFMHMMRHLIDYSNLHSTLYLVHPYYDIIYMQEYRDFLKEVRDSQSLSLIIVNSELKYADVLKSNIICNMRYLLEGQSVTQYKNILPANIPVIIVSAGPSLNKNKHLLKEAKGKAVIIAADTAVKAMLNIDVVPDLIMTVDPQKSMESLFKKEHVRWSPEMLEYVQNIKRTVSDITEERKILWSDPELYFEEIDERVLNIPMIAGICSNMRILSRNATKKIVMETGLGIEKEMLTRNNKSTTSLESGGSVSNDIFSFALHMGAKTIILIGQDLAYTGGKKHAAGIYHEEHNVDTNTKGKFEVEDIYGNKVYSREDYYQYLLWFNNIIVRTKDCKVIDATEGGAKIQGTEIMTFREAIDRECKGQFDIQEIIQNMPSIFNEEECNKVFEYIMGTPNRLKKVKEKAVEGAKINKQLIKSVKNKTYNTPATLKLIKKLGKINDFLDHAEDMSHITQYMKAIEIEVNKNLHKVYENLDEEIIDVSERQIKLMEAIAKSVDDMADNIEFMLRLTQQEMDRINGKITIKYNSIPVI